MPRYSFSNIFFFTRKKKSQQFDRALGKAINISFKKYLSDISK